MGMNEKGLNRGGTLGQEGELEGGVNRSQTVNQRRDGLNQRDQQKQQGGIGREPDRDRERNEKLNRQPRHQVD